MEQEFVNWLRTQVRSHPKLYWGREMMPHCCLPDHRDLVVTSDLLTEGVDFMLDESDPRRIGRKALAVNLSDLAAMAAQPVAALVSVALPDQGAISIAEASTREYWNWPKDLKWRWLAETPIPGTASWWSASRPLAKWLPAGHCFAAEPGRRRILATGDFGGSILGKHFDFEPRVKRHSLLQTIRAHAGIDVSDGLSLDLSRMAKESRCGALLCPHQVPLVSSIRMARRKTPR